MKHVGQKRQIHHFLPHFLATVGAVVVVYVAVLSTWPNPHQTPAYAEDGIGSTSPNGQQAAADSFGCYTSTLDSNGDGILSTSESQSFSTCYAENSIHYGQTMYGSGSTFLVCDLNHDRYINLADQSCYTNFQEQSATPLILSPVPGSENAPGQLVGVAGAQTKIRVRSSTFATTQSSTVTMIVEMRLPGAPTFSALTSRSFVVGQYLVGGTSDTVVELPFSTLIIPNETTIRITICPPSGSTTSCSAPATYTVERAFAFQNPQGLTFSGDTHVGVGVSDQPSTVTYLVLPGANAALNTSGTVVSQTVTNPGDGSYPVTFAHLASGTYTVWAIYQPSLDWGGFYGAVNLRAISETITVLSTTGEPTNTNTAPPTPTNTNTVTTNTNRNITVNTNTAPSTNTNRTVTNPAASGTVPAAPTIELPQKNVAYYKLSSIAGSAPDATQVSIRVTGFGLSNTSCAQKASLNHDLPAPVTNGRFLYSLPSELCPGSYQVAVTPVNGTLRGAVQTAGFAIVPARLEFQSLSGAPVNGVVTVVVKVDGSVTELHIVAYLGSTSIDLGTASPVAGSTSQYSLTVDTKQKLGPGSYQLVARGQGLDGVVRESVNVLSIHMADGTASTPVASTTPSASPPTSTTPPTSVPATDTQVAGDISSLTSQQPATPTANISTQAKADPRQQGSVVPEKLKVAQYANVQAPVADQPSAIKLNGVGPADTVVTLFIYSDPIVVTTRTDANGNWTYTLDRTLGDGRHEVYVTITDDTGQVKEKGAPLSFFVKTARAVTQEEYFTPAPTTRESDTFMIYYIAMAALLVALAVGIIIYIRVSRSTPKLHIT